jgi:hypothetical protein
MVLLPQTSNGGGSSVQFVSLHGDQPFLACAQGCTFGFGPVRVQSPIFNWSADGRNLHVALQYFGLRGSSYLIYAPPKSNLYRFPLPN